MSACYDSGWLLIQAVIQAAGLAWFSGGLFLRCPGPGMQIHVKGPSIGFIIIIIK